MDANPRSVLASGFVALDVVRRGQGVWMRAGGTAGNVAANLAYFGWKARIAGLIGRDEAGCIVSRDLSDAGVDTSDLYQHDEVGTPLVLHEVNGKSHRFKFGCSVCGRPYHRYRPLPTAKVPKLLSGGVNNGFPAGWSWTIYPNNSSTAIRHLGTAGSASAMSPRRKITGLSGSLAL